MQNLKNCRGGEMRVITVKAGDKLLYVEPQYIEVVIAQPLIWKVPQAEEAIRGISCYEKKLVVYYQFSGETMADCGVLLKISDEFLSGIAADEVEGESDVEEEDMAQLMTGVWESKRD